VKLLNGKELASYIKERQAREVRTLRQAWQTIPKLAIILSTDNPASQAYTRLKKRYGEDILVEVEIHQVSQKDIRSTIEALNIDPSVHGIILQLPLAEPEETEALVNLVAPEKDVDALGEQAQFDPATPLAILWLLAGYNVDLQQGKKVVLVGQGRLVGRPLERMLKASGVNVTTINSGTKDAKSLALAADIIITATGSPGVLTTDMVKPGAVVVDAGTAGEDGKLVGDISPDLYERDDLTITPQKGGVGPLTVCALFDNLIQSARRTAQDRAAHS
jgi:methylenetetrahydrofolate dehydrogenase (NADP+)/methenyltetrahydrofolate cyclohydrolase